jgi:hypothetical protein
LLGDLLVLLDGFVIVALEGCDVCDLEPQLVGEAIFDMMLALYFHLKALADFGGL